MENKKKSRKGAIELLPLVVVLVFIAAMTAYLIQTGIKGSFLSDFVLKILTVLLVGIVGLALIKLGIEPITAVSLMLGLLYAYFFFYYGVPILNSVVDFMGIKANAANFFIIWFILLYIGGALIASVPQIVAGRPQYVISMILLFLGIGFIHGFADMNEPPFCGGKFSPYQGLTVCNLPSSAFAIDCVVSCYGVERFGINPFGSTGTFLTYGVESSIMLLLGLAFLKGATMIS